MQLRLRSRRRLYVGLLILAIGLGGVWFAADLRFGRVGAMGPGFLPTVISWLIAAMGIAILGMMFHDDVETIEPVAPRPVLMIFASVGLFALLIDPAGLGIAVFVTAFVASYAGPARFVETLILSLCAAIACCLLFVTVLGLPLDILPEAN